MASFKFQKGLLATSIATVLGTAAIAAPAFAEEAKAEETAE